MSPALVRWMGRWGSPDPEHDRRLDRLERLGEAAAEIRDGDLEHHHPTVRDAIMALGEAHRSTYGGGRRT